MSSLKPFQTLTDLQPHEHADLSTLFSLSAEF